MAGRLRRHIPWWVLALVFVVLPVVEIFILIQIGQVIGAWWTIVLLIADGFFGSWLMKHEGARAFAALRAALQAGRMPARELADGALILVGGVLLVTPGFLTDVAGLFCVLPFTRPVARAALTRVVSSRLVTVNAPGPGSPDPSPHRRTDPGTPQRPGPVVQGEVVE